MPQQGRNTTRMVNHQQRRRQRRRNGLMWLSTTGAIMLGLAALRVLYVSGQTKAAQAMPPQTGLSHSPTSAVRPPGSSPLPSRALIQVPVISQMPQLPNGCEVTSLSMLLTAIGHPIDKLTLAKEMPKDPTREVLSAAGSIIFWGDPNVGFVGNVYDQPLGYGIYHGPMTHFVNQLLPGRAIDLSGKPFTDILRYVANGTPVELWDTSTFHPTTHWVTWQSPEGPIRATMDEHAVLLVGYNATTLFINNPLTDDRAEAVNRQSFLAAWKQLGEQALTVGPAH